MKSNKGTTLTLTGIAAIIAAALFTLTLASCDTGGSPGSSGTEIIGGGGRGGLTGIAVTTPPAKTTYRAGQTFSTDGMVVTASYSGGVTIAVTNYTYTPSGTLTETNTAVTISYTEDAITKTASVAITVGPDWTTSTTVPNITFPNASAPQGWTTGFDESTFKNKIAVVLGDLAKQAKAMYNRYDTGTMTNTTLQAQGKNFEDNIGNSVTFIPGSASLLTTLSQYTSSVSTLMNNIKPTDSDANMYIYSDIKRVYTDLIIGEPVDPVMLQELSNQGVSGVPALADVTAGWAKTELINRIPDGNVPVVGTETAAQAKAAVLQQYEDALELQNFMKYLNSLYYTDQFMDQLTNFGASGLD